MKVYFEHTYYAEWYVEVFVNQEQEIPWWLFYFLSGPWSLYPLTPSPLNSIHLQTSGVCVPSAEQLVTRHNDNNAANKVRF